MRAHERLGSLYRLRIIGPEHFWRVWTNAAAAGATRRTKPSPNGSGPGFSGNKSGYLWSHCLHGTAFKTARGDCQRGRPLGRQSDRHGVSGLCLTLSYYDRLITPTHIIIPAVTFDGVRSMEVRGAQNIYSRYHPDHVTAGI